MTFLVPIIDKHAPPRIRRIEHPKLPQWLTKHVNVAMAISYRLKKGKQFDDIKKTEKQSEKFGALS